MAESPLALKAAGGRLGLPVYPRSRSGSESESEAELSLSLARTKTRSYGSTASVTAAAWAEKYTEHPVSSGDTLQGIALKYGVTVRKAGRGKEAHSAALVEYGGRGADGPGLADKRRR
ncbi:hypothetical protein NDU88_005882 [Pleurodeles waltl]|uniref:LysM and putative peptidoglycan-binding domain-containing protein 2 n=1 Tax=Pleurodeles waltl TaxID=8319 RepID=A0AAV7TV80_PLEWA|nr:hypothetical protein NDU88_005882 [Pleurodeles waltl]